MKVVCIINARGNSKGLPGKNIRMFGDKPLIAHTIESAINSKICDRVVVSTDDEEIAEISREYGAETPFMRPKDLANEFVHPEKSLVHAVEDIISSGYQFDITVMRDCTEPFIDEDDIITDKRVNRLLRLGTIVHSDIENAVNIFEKKKLPI